MHQIHSIGRALLCGFILIVPVACQVARDPARVMQTSEPVGRAADGRVVTPVNQVLTPLGQEVQLAGLRPLSVALSRSSREVYVTGKTSELLVLDAGTGAILQRVGFPNEALIPGHSEAAPEELDTEAQSSYTGLVLSKDGGWIYLSNVNGSIKVFQVDPEGRVHPSHVLALPPANAPRRTAEIPSGLALSADDTKLYVCGNLSNQLLVLDVKTGRLQNRFDVGVAPYDVVVDKGRAWVSNWGGGRPEEGQLTGPAGRGTRVRVDPVRHIASQGSVSVVDLSGDAGVREIRVGLHPGDLVRSPDGDYVVCANAASDNLSVIAIASEQVVETIWTRPKPSDLFGASPNALAFSDDGETLFVANGTQNAIAVVEFEPREQESKLTGLLPVGWFPSALALDTRGDRLLVANLKGLSPGRAGSKKGQREYNTHQYHGSLSFVPLGELDELGRHTRVVWDNLRRPAIEQARLRPRRGQPARVVPERIGEPSLLRHVVYVIKENRTYDQVLGDMPEGNGEPDLCVFPERITPNQHALSRAFVLLDNTYCAGILSADGHQWSTTAFATDVMEKSFAGFPRSYPDGMGEDDADALVYSPAGFIWDNATTAGLSIRNYGEFTGPAVRWSDSARAGSPGYSDCYQAWHTGSNEVHFASEPMIESIRAFTPTGYVGWEMKVPDQYRADFILKELEEFEQQGRFPALTIICLPNDHTTGTSAGSPTPASHMADNDLAFGRIVEAFSHSSFWGEMVIFGIEDDPQAGWDHVSGYRTTAYVASPYAKRGEVVSTQYNTTSVLRTIEQILGLPVMNQFDASATPMFDCFTSEPDFTPFDALPANVPLNQMNPDPSSVLDPRLREDALVSSTLNFQEVDRAPEDVLNQVLWRAMRGTQLPYPHWATGSGSDGDDTD